ncbi:MAG: leucine--tRNA ligase [Treponema sp.]|nr:MAG: leucine--tRNA ligase [Treponema sp.]
MSNYNFTEIEKKWQDYWEKSGTFKTYEDENFPKEKRHYVLDMFPYPSGSGLHVGHLEGYTATDIYSRFLRMQGFNVLHPMGFDAFGLPAENYAIKTGIHPNTVTQENITRFRSQMKAMGLSYDWSREVQTCSPEYYKWTQWLFLKLFKRGLAYEKEAPINWCPSCKTGLANEEVKDGKCDRCGETVGRKNLRQWILKITAYAERLLSDLEKLDWSDSLKQMQRNWIGKSSGAEVDFELFNSNKGNINEKSGKKIRVYTTRPDTLFGATYMVLAPEHPLVAEITTDEQKGDIEKYIEASSKKSDLERTDLAKDKTGVFTGAFAENPVNGDRIPVWISDYILLTYGTGAIMAVPAHDERDWDFAKKFDLPIRQVVASEDEFSQKTAEDACSKTPEACVSASGVSVNSGEFTGLKTPEAIKKITEMLTQKGIGKAAVNYKLRDWVFSRQRYWGEPIPIVHCPKCGAVPVPEEELPLTLPKVESYKPSGTGESPLSAIDEWVNTKCPVCGENAKRETNTMPQWAGSCWYYLRYLDPNNDTAFVDSEKEKYWLPVDLYVGGAEHAVLHLLYARFWHKVFYDEGLVTEDEPFKKLVNQGLITAFGYTRKNKSLVPVDEVTQKSETEFIETATGEKLTQIVTKMSKSLKNVVSPDEPIGKYGADACRLYSMFMGPLEMSKPWNTQGLIGVFRFLEKVWAVFEKEAYDASRNDVSTEETAKLTSSLHKTIKKVTCDTETLNFNTAISQMMIFINEAGKYKKLPKFLLLDFVKLLSPYAPHLAEELWQKLGHDKSIAYERWPSYEEKFCIDSTCTVVVQINGKVRDKFEVELDTSKDELEKIALQTQGAKKWTEGKTIKKIIVVPNKIVNIVAT